MVLRQKIKYRGVLLTLGLLFSPLMLADNSREKHWSEGVYFTPQAMPKHRAWGTYAPGSREAQTRSSATVREKYNPWVVRSTGSRSRRPREYGSFAYPNRNFGAHEQIIRYGSRAASTNEPQIAQPSEFAAAEYYPKRSHHELHTPAFRTHGQVGEYGHVRSPRSYHNGNGAVAAYRDYTSSYRNPADERGRGGNMPPLPNYAMSEYPSQDYDPYARNAPSRNSAPDERKPHVTHHYDYRSESYRPDLHRYESDPASSVARNRYDHDYGARPYDTRRGLDNFSSPHGSDTYSVTTLNPFFMYSTGIPYSPYMW